MDVDDGQTTSPRAPGKPPMPRTGWPRPLDRRNKPVKKKAHWWDAYHDEGDDQGRWLKAGSKTQPPPGYVTDACPKCESSRDFGKHNYGDECEERVVDPNARCALCARECPRRRKVPPEEHFCNGCRISAGIAAASAARAPKRDAQARKRADEGYDDNAGHQDRYGAARRDGTQLKWNELTPDQPRKTLEQCLEVHLDAVDASGADYGSQVREATELLRLLNGSNPKSFADGVDYTGAVASQVRRIRNARGHTSSKPLSPYGCANFEVWLPEMERLAQVACAACRGRVGDFGVISALVLFLISYNVLAFLTLHLECFCRALRREKPNNREGAAGPESTRAMLLYDRQISSRNAPLWLFRGVVLVELGICGRDPTYTAYFYRTFMMTGSAPGLRLPFYKCMHAVNVMMLSSRGYSALYHAYADCIFGRMASRRAIFFAPNVKEEDEQTVGHNFLWSLYQSGAELRQLVSRIEPGVRAQILVRPRLGEIAVFEWDGSDDGIYLRLWRLRRDESLAPN